MSAINTMPPPVVTGAGTVATAQVFDWLLGTLPRCARAGWVPKLDTVPLDWLEPLRERHENTVRRFAGAATNVISALQAVEAHRVRHQESALRHQRKIGAALRDGRTLPGTLAPVDARALLDPAWGAFGGLCEETATLIEEIASTAVMHAGDAWRTHIAHARLANERMVSGVARPVDRALQDRTAVTFFYDSVIEDDAVSLSLQAAADHLRGLVTTWRKDIDPGWTRAPRIGGVV